MSEMFKGIRELGKQRFVIGGEAQGFSTSLTNHAMAAIEEAKDLLDAGERKANYDTQIQHCLDLANAELAALHDALVDSKSCDENGFEKFHTVLWTTSDYLTSVEESTK